MSEGYTNISAACRRKAHLTQEQWAEALGVSVETVKAWERDIRIPSNYHVCLMVDLCGETWYCYKHLKQTSSCLDVLPDAEKQSLPQASIRLINKIFQFADKHRDRQLLQIAEDGQIDAEERPLYDEIVAELNELVNAAFSMDSIAMNGILDPLIVTPAADQPGKYRLISGHRRRTAIKKLVDGPDNRQDLRLVPCFERSTTSAAMEELQLIMANSTTRILTDAEKMRQAERIEMLLYELKEQGVEFPGRMRDHVAAACSTSAAKLGRLKYISANLCPELMKQFERKKGGLSEQAAYAMAHLPHELQQRIMRLYAATIGGSEAEWFLRKYNAGFRWEPELTCPDGKPCKGGDRFLRHDSLYSYDACGGNTCCLTCSKATSKYSACESACSKAKAVRKTGLDAEKEAAAKADEKMQMRYRKEAQKKALRLLPVIDASGLPVISSIHVNHYHTEQIKDIRDTAAGIYGSQRYYSDYLDFKSAPLATAQKLNCSVDFLLGKTDDWHILAPEPQADTEPVSNLDTSPAAMVWRDAKLDPPETSDKVLIVSFYPDGPDYDVGAYDTERNRWRYGDQPDYWIPFPQLPELPERKETHDDSTEE